MMGRDVVEGYDGSGDGIGDDNDSGIAAIFTIYTCI